MGQARLCVVNGCNDRVDAHAERGAYKYRPLSRVRLWLRASPLAFENFGEFRVTHGTPPKARMLRKDSGLFVFGVQRCVAADHPVRKNRVRRAYPVRCYINLSTDRCQRRYSVARHETKLFNNQSSHLLFAT